MDTRNDRDQTSAARIAASIEVTPRQAVEAAELPGLFPRGTSVYVADVGNADLPTLVAAARRIRDLGYEPVPHLAARRLTSRHELERRVAALSQEAGVGDMLVIGGGLSRPAGVFDSAMAVLETMQLDRYGIKCLGVAGHPEGSPDFSDAVAFDALRRKQQFAARTGARVRIVTQFGFNPAVAIGWAESLAQHGIDLPVHMGVAGPAKVTTLIKYAAMCGVGNSIDFLRKQARSLTGLVTNQSPETVVGPIEDHWHISSDSVIAQMHVYPFGGIRKASDWLVARGSWRLS